MLYLQYLWEYLEEFILIFLLFILGSGLVIQKRITGKIGQLNFLNQEVVLF